MPATPASSWSATDRPEQLGPHLGLRTTGRSDVPPETIATCPQGAGVPATQASRARSSCSHSGATSQHGRAGSVGARHEHARRALSSIAARSLRPRRAPCPRRAPPPVPPGAARGACRRAQTRGRGTAGRQLLQRRGRFGSPRSTASRTLSAPSDTPQEVSLGTRVATSGEDARPRRCLPVTARAAPSPPPRRRAHRRRFLGPAPALEPRRAADGGGAPARGGRELRQPAHRRRAQGAGRFRGLVFMDSDVYKWLEAARLGAGREPSGASSPRLADDADRAVADAQDQSGYLNTPLQRRPAARARSRICRGPRALLPRAPDPGRRWRTRGRGRRAPARRCCALRRARRGAPSGRGGARAAGPPRDRDRSRGAVPATPATSAICRLAQYFVDARGRETLPDAPLRPRLPAGPRAGPRGTGDHRTRGARALPRGGRHRPLPRVAASAALLATMERLWADMAGRKMYLTGGVGARHTDEAFGDPYELPPDRPTPRRARRSPRSSGTGGCFCTGDARHADLMERTLYNGFLAGVSHSTEAPILREPAALRGEHTSAGVGSPAPAARPT